MSSNFVEVEVNLKRKSNLDQSKVEPLLGPWLRKLEYVSNSVQMPIEDVEDLFDLKDHVEYVMVCGDHSATTHMPSVNIIYRYNV